MTRPCVKLFTGWPSHLKEYVLILADKGSLVYASLFLLLFCQSFPCSLWASNAGFSGFLSKVLPQGLCSWCFLCLEHPLPLSKWPYHLLRDISWPPKLKRPVSLPAFFVPLLKVVLLCGAHHHWPCAINGAVWCLCLSLACEHLKEQELCEVLHGVLGTQFSAWHICRVNEWMSK